MSRRSATARWQTEADPPPVSASERGLLLPSPEEQRLPNLPPLLQGALTVLVGVCAVGTALAVRRAVVGYPVPVLDIVATTGLATSAAALAARRWIGRRLFPSGPAPAIAIEPSEERTSGFVLASERATGQRHVRPLLQSVTLAPDRQVHFESAFGHWNDASRAACLDSLRDLRVVREVHVASVSIVDSGRMAPRVLVVAVDSAADAAEAYTALYTALEQVAHQEKIRVWFVAPSSERIHALRAAGCLAMRRRTSVAPSLSIPPPKPSRWPADDDVPPWLS